MEHVDPREIEMLRQYLNEFGQQIEIQSQQLAMLEGKRMEAMAATETIRGLKESPGATVLLQIGGGASMRVQAPNPDEILMNIGSDVIITKNADDAASFLEDRMTEIEAMEKRIASSIEDLQRQAQEVSRKIEMAYQQFQDAGQYQTGYE